MMAQQVSLKKQQGTAVADNPAWLLMSYTELQQQYTIYKNGLQQLAQKIGDIEQDAEEHK